jgi:hypothetical protein
MDVNRKTLVCWILTLNILVDVTSVLEKLVSCHVAQPVNKLSFLYGNLRFIIVFTATQQ